MTYYVIFYRLFFGVTPVSQAENNGRQLLLLRWARRRDSSRHL